MTSDFPKSLLPLLQKPIWQRSTEFENIEFLALDFETSGLIPKIDEILSMGWVVIKNGQIKLDSACRLNICSSEQIKPEIASLTHIVPETLASGIPISQAMQRLIISMAGRVLIAHSAPIERGFIHQYCQRTFSVSSLPLVWLDTLNIEKSLVRRRTRNRIGDFRLSMIRADYGLPNYPGHDALIDAVAAGELFLAQTKYIFGLENPRLGALFKRSQSNYRRY